MVILLPRCSCFEWYRLCVCQHALNSVLKSESSQGHHPYLYFSLEFWACCRFCVKYHFKANDYKPIEFTSTCKLYLSWSFGLVIVEKQIIELCSDFSRSLQTTPPHPSPTPLDIRVNTRKLSCLHFSNSRSVFCVFAYNEFVCHPLRPQCIIWDSVALFSFLLFAWWTE